MTEINLKNLKRDCIFVMENSIKKVDYADIRIENNIFTSIEVKNQDIESCNIGENYGAGIRVACGGGWGFASTTKLEKEILLEKLDLATKLAKASSKGLKKINLAEIRIVEDEVKLKVKKDVRDISLEEKCRDMLEINKNVQAHDKRIRSSRLSYTDFVKKKIFFSSQGANIEMNLPEVEVNFNVTSSEGDITQWARSRETGQMGYEFFQQYDMEKLGKYVADKSIDLIHGEKTPGGLLTVVIDPANVGVFIHEAFGHANEADSVLQRRSFQYGMLGKKMASDIVTVETDPTIEYKKGTYPYDDEGTPTEKFTIIDKGTLVNYMHTRETAYELKMKPNGCARAADYSVKPIARMNNLYIKSGEWKLEEIIEDTKYGLLIEGSRGGMEDPESGGFQLSAQNCYLIEKGEVKKPLRDVSITGKTLDVLTSIDALADDFYLYPGHCGKGEPGIMQTAGVSDGGPHLRVGNVLVGGTQ